MSLARKRNLTKRVRTILASKRRSLVYHDVSIKKCPSEKFTASTDG